MVKITIRKANIEDAKIVAPYIYETSPNAFRLMLSDDISETYKAIENLFTKEKSIVSYNNSYIIEKDNQIYGIMNINDKISYRENTLKSVWHTIKILGIMQFIKKIPTFLELSKCVPKLDEKSLYLAYFAVDSKKRNQGLGTELLNYLSKLAVELNKDKIYLVVEYHNVSAQRLYKRNNYKIFAEQTPSNFIVKNGFAGVHFMVKKL